jgi:ZIP family zinc transporter
MDSAVVFAGLVTLGAGLATAVGAAIGLFAHHTNRAFLALALGFSAGVMIYVSFIEILPKATSFLVADWGDAPGNTVMVGAFLAGLAVMALLYRFLPDLEHPQLDDRHEALSLDEDPSSYYANSSLLKAGIGVALAVTLHNFPEGMATFFLTLDDPQVGLSVAFAIAIHNIPEGIAVAVPIYYATKSRKTAFAFGALSGLAEPIGAFLGFAILQPFITDTVLGIVFAAVAGVMVYISVDSLLPAARQYGKGQLAIYGLIAGMAVMAGSLILFSL